MTTVGILGGGQLGRMLALAGVPLGLAFRFYDPGSAGPVAGLGRTDHAAWDDVEALDDFAEAVDVVTWEFENVPVESVERLGRKVPVFPTPASLAVAQDRLAEKSRFEALGIPTNAWAAVDSPDDLAAALDRIGTPSVLKTRRFGYDGKGQEVLRGEVDPEAVWREIGEVPCILEAFVDFDRELSLVAARTVEGDFAFYPLVENEHRRGILFRTLAPAPAVDDALRAKAEGYVRALLDDLDYVGVAAVEFFQVGGELLANEMAPRVHNSGHWTQDGARTSQFENHLRAGLGLPLGPTGVRGTTVMLNLLGEVPEISKLFFDRGARLHLYGKAPRPGRKLGHVNVIGARAEEVEEVVARLEAILPEGAGPA